MVKTKEASNPKFSFLKFDDPYRPYFDAKVKEYQKGSGNAAPQGIFSDLTFFKE
jgi:hypothetical protein